MILLVRDEDVPTLGSAITAIALQHEIEPVDHDATADLFAIAAALVSPLVSLAAGEDFVLVEGLASLGIGDADTWGKALSGACETEVVAVAPSANGVRVAVFEDGELEDHVAVDLDPSGRVRSPALAEIAPTDEAAAELRAGVPALNGVELAAQVLRLFGAGEDQLVGEALTLGFHDPRADEDALDDDEDDA